MVGSYVPERGDIVWLSFDPQAGHEQAGRRPALVLSEHRFNEAIGLIVCCPVTSRAKGYPFEVAIPPGLPISGVVLADQVRSLDWRARDADFAGKAPSPTLAEVRRLVRLLI